MLTADALLLAYYCINWNRFILYELFLIQHVESIYYVTSYVQSIMLVGLFVLHIH